MSNLPIVVQSGEAPVLPSELLSKLRGQLNTDFAGFGSNFRRIKARRVDFLLSDGDMGTAVPADQMFAVFIGAASYNHCTWYEREYTLGQEPEQPDLLWIQRSADYFPEALPQMFRKKIIRAGAERWAFQIARRTVWALIRTDANGQRYVDLQNPYVFDLSSMNLYGKSHVENNMFKWNGLCGFCNQHTNPAFVCTPSMFPMQIVLDVSATVTGVVMFRPARDSQTGNLQFFDAGLIQEILATRETAAVQDLLTVREKLDYKGSASAPVQTAAPAAPLTVTQPVAPAAPAAPAAPLTVTQPVAPAAPAAQPVAPAAPAAQPAAPAAQPAAPAAPAAPTDSLLVQAQAILSEAAAPIAPLGAAQSPATPAGAPMQSAQALENLLSSLG